MIWILETVATILDGLLSIRDFLKNKKSRNLIKLEMFNVQMSTKFYNYYMNVSLPCLKLKQRGDRLRWYEKLVKMEIITHFVQ